jgi:hypothetical protein
MKPRALKTYKILAVALAATGCTKAVGPDPSTEPTAESISQEAPAKKAADPAPAEAVNAPGSPAHATDVPSAAAIATPPIDRPLSNDPALVALRGELAGAGRAGALAKVTHFRPLCDKDGYPLVGNVVMGKAEHPGDHYQPSAFCGELRQKQAQR